ncbi:carboxymuconolactone decarboxylase family protein [Irregularibacter muris]|uniref:Carboxymuconolactone decarboxylase family protein n=1 Tax=Irregularibacter muris TaxID=1796619 RepID=A0AAE3HDR8_9FIRM|nr:carboxymuconolactone decarboxylase family protein [Irregularibacter muris]MCR1898572.1 carboxymuconolactone decarboxylase family protein [Irregularibacter muris]
MSRNPREMLNEFVGGLDQVGEESPEFVGSFMGLLGAAYQEGALSVKVKELMSVAIGAYNRCEYCIVYHVYKAFEAGATKEEIMEAAQVAVAFGGGPSMAFTVSLVKESIAEFEKDFQ